MAKAQTMKTKSSIAEWFKSLGAPKPAARPGASAQSSTLTNVPAASATRSGAKAAKSATASAIRKPAKAESGWSLADFRLPVIGHRPVIVQMQILGSIAALLLVATAIAVFDDTRTRTQNATQIS